MKEFLKGGKFL